MSLSREISYVLMDPSGNRTILAETPVDAADQPGIAEELMKQEPSAEQAGFVRLSSGNTVDLRMAGGEFCGNAAMSAAVYKAEQSGMVSGEVQVIFPDMPQPVKAFVRRNNAGYWDAEVEMPAPVSIETAVMPDGKQFPVVKFNGISHVIIEQGIEKNAETLARERCAALRADAVGLMYLDREHSVLTPLVYVPGAGTMFWESACGSGSTAVGCWMAREQNRNVRLSLRQPGGELTISADPSGHAVLGGRVTTLCRKTVLISK